MSEARMDTLPPGENSRRLAALARIWNNAPGWRGQLTAVNHGTVGLRFIATGFAFLLAGGALAMFIRLQLAWPGNQVLDPERYAQFVSQDHQVDVLDVGAFLVEVPQQPAERGRLQFHLVDGRRWSWCRCSGAWAWARSWAT